MAEIIENETLSASANSNNEVEATVNDTEVIEASALNVTVRNGYSPFIGENGYWYQWDSNIQAFVNTGVPANGSGEIQGTTNYNELKNLPTIGNELIKGDVSSIIKQMIADAQVDLSGYATLSYLTEQLKKIDQINVPLWALNDTKPTYDIAEIKNAARVSKTGSYSDLYDVPTSLKNPNALTIKGITNTSTYDGSEAVTVDLNAEQISVYDGLDSTETGNALSANQGRALKETLNSLEKEIDAIQIENNTTYSLAKNEGTYADSLYLIGSDGKVDTITLGLTDIINRIAALEADNAELKAWKESVLTGGNSVLIEGGNND